MPLTIVYSYYSVSEGRRRHGVFIAVLCFYIKNCILNKFYAYTSDQENKNISRENMNVSTVCAFSPYGPWILRHSFYFFFWCRSLRSSSHKGRRPVACSISRAWRAPCRRWTLPSMAGIWPTKTTWSACDKNRVRTGQNCVRRSKAARQRGL